jgi:uncharacterized protein YhaN
MVRHTAFVVVIAAVFFSGAFLVRVPAQQQTSPQTELLGEVRLLRQAIESLAGTNARVQIVFGRLQLQEQRTTNALRRLDEARAALAGVVQQLADMSDNVKNNETMVAEARGKPEEIEQARLESMMMKQQIDRMEVVRARLAGEEAEASAALNQEQGRWSDLNRQLEELERALVKRE